MKIIWPERWTAGNVDDDVPDFLLSVNGVHCRLGEPKHPIHSKNPAFYSHKFHQAGVNYEIGISLCTNGTTRAKKCMKVTLVDIMIDTTCHSILVWKLGT